MIPMLVTPLRRELDAETMRWLRVEHLRREFRKEARTVNQLERAVASTTGRMRPIYERKLRAAQERLYAVRDEFARVCCTPTPTRQP